MPAKSAEYWTAKAQQGNSWYGDELLDWQAAECIWRALRRLRLPIDETTHVLDVGCGDGRFSVSLAVEYGCSVVGVDLYNFGPAQHPKVAYRFGVDVERLGHDSRLLADVGVVMSVLECVSDWRRVLWEAGFAVPRLIVVEELRREAAPYQQLPHKTALTWDEFRKAADEAGWDIVRWEPATIVDRALVLKVPRYLRPAAVRFSVWLDGLLSRLPKKIVGRWARFRAVYMIERERR